MELSIRKVGRGADARGITGRTLKGVSRVSQAGLNGWHGRVIGLPITGWPVKRPGRGYSAPKNKLSAFRAQCGGLSQTFAIASVRPRVASIVTVVVSGLKGEQRESATTSLGTSLGDGSPWQPPGKKQPA